MRQGRNASRQSKTGSLLRMASLATAEPCLDEEVKRKSGRLRNVAFCPESDRGKGRGEAETGFASLVRGAFQTPAVWVPALWVLRELIRGVRKLIFLLRLSLVHSTPRLGSVAAWQPAPG